jgi:para-aminobenzoate synthetase component 1
MILSAGKTDLQTFKQKALQWSVGFDVSACLDSGNFTDQYSRLETLIAIGVEQHNGWVFGFLTYDLKNEVEELSSNNPDHLHFPDLYFFVPQHLIIIKNSEIEIISAEAEGILKSINGQEIQATKPTVDINIKSRFSKAEYIDTVKTIQQHIIRGDIYETNFCQEFYAEDVNANALSNAGKRSYHNPLKARPKEVQIHWKMSSSNRALKITPKSSRKTS